jgi:hypothetical protein
MVVGAMSKRVILHCLPVADALGTHDLRPF